MADPWHLRIRRDTAAGWTLKNPIMLAEVIGLETDTRRFKVGNGITPWRLLPYGDVMGPEGKLLVFISEDAENQLQYGSDGGLYIREPDINPLAFYTLAKS